MFYIPESGPPTAFPRDLGIYESMGEANIFKMIEDFYQELGMSSIKEMFNEDLKKASQKSAAFFVFLLGGPPLYHERHGSPRMRQRHLAFTIDKEVQMEWFRCFSKVFSEADTRYLFPKEHKKAFLKFIFEFSLWMINSKEESRH